MTPRLAVLLVLAFAGCTATPTAPSDAPPGQSNSLTANLTFCFEETNRYRAMAGAPAVARSDAIEAHAAIAAQSDGVSNSPHAYSRANSSGRWAENEVLRWPLSQLRTVRGVIAEAMASFWRQGASGGHYQNLTGPYSSVGCGVYVSGNDVTVVQHFR